VFKESFTSWLNPKLAMASKIVKSGGFILHPSIGAGVLKELYPKIHKSQEGIFRNLNLS